MKRLMMRMPLMAKLLIIALIPLVFIFYLTNQLALEKSRNVQQLESYKVLINQASTISHLIDQLQKERKYSFDYALTKTNREEMLSQRPVTDSVLHQLSDISDESLKDFSTYTFLANLDSVRTLIANNKYAPNQIMHFYSSSIFRLNTLNKLPILPKGNLKEANVDMTSQRLLSEMITYQGIINANVYNVLYTHQYMIETLLGTLGTYDVYKSYQKEFAIKASPGALKAYNSFYEKGAFHEIDSYLQKLFSTFKFDSSYTYQSWNVLSEKSISELRGIQMNLLGTINQSINSLYQQEVNARSRAVINMIGVIVLIIALLGFILFAINNSLKALKDAAIKLAAGQTDIKVQVDSNDAIGSLAQSIYSIDEKNKELATAARRIGDGDFNVKVKPRSSHDDLGNAIVQMKDNLETFTNDIKRSQAELIMLADFMPQIVWMANERGETTYYNRKWYEITGLKNSSLHHNWISVLHPDDVGRTLNLWYQALQSGRPFESECRIKDVRSNTYRWFLGRAVPLKDEHGKIIKWFGTNTDIHDQKLLHEKLEDLVSQRTTELNRSNEDLQRFAHVASHDLKEPLRKICTFSQRLQIEHGESIPAKGKIYLDKIQHSSERMSNMIESILNYSLINSSDQLFEPVDLNIIIEEIKDDLELMIVPNDAEINFRNLPVIKGTPTLIHQLFYNLINNALKFAKHDSKNIISVTANDRLDFSFINKDELDKNENYTDIIVSDNGIGFNQEYSKKMFDIFARLNTREKFEGTGLGLALCKKIVQRHKGVIYAMGEEGIGATFHIILPKF